jgi:hypothetical protein
MLLALTPALDLQLLSERHHLSRVNLFDLLARFAVCERHFGVSHWCSSVIVRISCRCRRRCMTAS